MRNSDTIGVRSNRVNAVAIITHVLATRELFAL
jgi:hypothetical protein